MFLKLTEIHPEGLKTYLQVKIILILILFYHFKSNTSYKLALNNDYCRIFVLDGSDA